MGRPADRDSVWLVAPERPFTIELAGTPLDALVLCEVTPLPDQVRQEWEVERVARDSMRLPAHFEWAAFRGHGPARPRFTERGGEAVAPAWHGDASLWRLRLPEAQENATWTLLVSLEGAAVPTRTPVPVEASADRSQPWFQDVTAEAGVRFLHLEGPDLQMDIRPTMGPGAAFGDFDGDGWQDLYLVQGGSRPGWPALPNRLFRNQGDGTFEDVTEAAQVGDTGAGMGALFFDVDGDRDLDLYVANYGADSLYQNQGDGTFVDISESAGLRASSEVASRWSASASASDFDGDGDLDVYVTSYLDYDLEKMPPPTSSIAFKGKTRWKCCPSPFPGKPMSCGAMIPRTVRCASQTWP